MNLTRAFTFVFDDREWLGKVTIITALTFASIVLLPVLLLGLLPFCILLGYMLDLVNNVRDGKREVLPAFKDFGDLLTRGSGVLLGLTVYNIPVIMISCCLWLVPGSFTGALDGIVTLIALCCLLPILLIYTAVTWPMLAVGVARYARGNSSGIFFQAGRLFNTVNDMGGYSIQWLLCALIVNFVYTILLFIPCLGWIAFAALAFPTQSHLVGQFARLIDNRHKKKGPSSPRPRPA